MKKDKLRFLALGFFLSGLILMVVQVSGISKPEESPKQATVESSVISESSSSKPVTETAKKPEPESESESSQSSDLPESEEPESSNEESRTSDTFVFVVHEGQPSSVVIENLYTTGLIEDTEAFQAYLEESELENSIQYGSYELSSDMSIVEIIDIITIQ